MKILIASDIHGSAYYCRRLIEQMNMIKPDKIFLLGDILYHGPRNDLPREYNPKKVIALLNPLKERITAVRGNCEAEVDQMVLDFDVMQTYKEADIDGIHFVLTHGHYFNKEKPFEYAGDYVLLNGHFHVPEITRQSGFIYVNVGSVSIPKANSPHSFAVYENGCIELKDLESGKAFLSLICP